MLVSQPDVVPTVNKSVPDFETEFAFIGSQKRNAQPEYVWLIPLIIETASLNTQNSVGRGVCVLPYGSTDSYKVKEARTDSNEVVVLKSLGYQVRSYGADRNCTLQPGALRKQKDSFDCRSWYRSVALNPDLWMERHSPLLPTVGVLLKDNLADSMRRSPWDTIADTTRSIPTRVSGHAFVYGLCDPWGNVWEGLSNMLRYNGELWGELDEGVLPWLLGPCSC